MGKKKRLRRQKQENQALGPGISVFPPMQVKHCVVRFNDDPYKPAISKGTTSKGRPADVFNVNSISVDEFLKCGFEMRAPFYVGRYEQKLKKTPISQETKAEIKDAYSKIWKAVLEQFKKGTASSENTIECAELMMVKLQDMTSDTDFINEVLAAGKEIFSGYKFKPVKEYADEYTFFGDFIKRD